MSSRRYAVCIVEQPAKAHRFRYASEIDATRSVGSIAGVNDDPANNHRTYPTIRVPGYYGPMLVMLCLVNPHNKLVHPHAITGKEEEKRREYKAGAMFLYTNGPEVSFNNIGIVCVRGKCRADIEAALQLREDFNIDPFTKGFLHMHNHDLINLDAVRLCFNVFLPAPEWTEDDRFNLRMYPHPLDAVLSDVIRDVKKHLKIVQLLECSGPMRGGTQIVMLCDNYGKDPPPEVVFVDPSGWSATADVTIHHKKVTLVFLTPPYRDPECSEPVQVEVCLRKRNAEGDMEYSAPAKFRYECIPEQRAKKQPLPPDYMSSKLLKETLFEEYLSGKVPDPHSAACQFLEVAPSKQDFMDASQSSFAAQPHNLDSWPQPCTSSNLQFLPQPTHLIHTHTSINENVTRKQTVNEPNHQNSTVNYVGSEIDNNIFSVSPDYSQQAFTSFDVNNFFQADYNTLGDGNVVQNSRAIDVKPNVVPDNFIHYDQTPDVISGANGAEIRDEFLHDEDLVHLCNAYIRDQNPFVSDSDAEMLSGELKNLQC